jgi:hypothetical protein
VRYPSDRPRTSLRWPIVKRLSDQAVEGTCLLLAWLVTGLGTGVLTLSNRPAMKCGHDVPPFI